MSSSNEIQASKRLENDPRRGRPITLVTVFGAIRRRESILLIRRAGPPYKGTVTVPGGHKLHGETLHESVAREMREETGLAMLNPRLVGFMQLESLADDRDFLSFYFASESFEGDLKDSEEGDVFWQPFGPPVEIENAHPAFIALGSRLMSSNGFFSCVARVDSEGRGDYQVRDLFYGP